MKVFVAGATGAIGRELIPRLVDAGHEVVGTYREVDLELLGELTQVLVDLGAPGGQLSGEPVRDAGIPNPLRE